MKKASFLLLFLTVIFLSLMVGIYIGRSHKDATFSISAEGPIESFRSEEAGTLEPININKATIDDLCMLPGIGKSTAQAIIDYRQKHGNYLSVDDLTKVPGIGSSTLEKFKYLITAGE